MNAITIKDKFNQHGFNIFFSQKLSLMPELSYLFTSEQKSKTLCMIASGGGALWPFITDKATAHPLDTYTLEQIQKISAEYLNGDVEILFPKNDKNNKDDLLLPLQKISRLFHFSHPSPMGIDISYDFGLWFGIRGVFLTNAHLPETISSPFISPCDSCAEKACLKSRLLCPYKSEKRYSEEELSYYQHVINTMLIKS